MESIKGETIYVRAIADPTGAIPSWIGEEIPVPYEVGIEVGAIRRRVVETLRSGKGRGAIAIELSHEYPCDAETMRSALSETFDQAALDVDVPTDQLVTLEDWDEYVVICCHFGLLVNRTLARLVGYILSEEAGSTVGVQQDAYRIVIQSAGVADAARILAVLRRLGDMDLDDLARKASVKTGMFKRRMVHVAKRFGAMSRWVDLSSVRLGRLMKSFEGTVISEETLNETLRKDLDLPNTKRVLLDIRDERIKLIAHSGLQELSPVAKLGIERISMKTDLIPSDKMKRILIDSARARILSESMTLVCTSCWNYSAIARISDLESSVTCPKCGSKSVASLSRDPSDMEIIMKRKGRAVAQTDKRVLVQLLESAEVVRKYGRAAVVVQAGRRLRPGDAKKILRKEKRMSDRLFELIMQAERDALKRRFL